VTFSIEIGGRTRTVSIEPAGDTSAAGGRFRVTLDEPGPDGRQLRTVVDARRTDLGWSIVCDADQPASVRRVIDAAVTERGQGEVLVELPHVSIRATVDGRRFSRGAADRDAAAGAERVVAPMPGRVVRVLVAVGDEVQARQGLVVVEAMKMENELGSTRAGRVVEIGVAEGQSVEAGRLLVRLE
jgi:biotin carboxyl carrier protein